MAVNTDILKKSFYLRILAHSSEYIGSSFVHKIHIYHYVIYNNSRDKNVGIMQVKRM